MVHDCKQIPRDAHEGLLSKLAESVDEGIKVPVGRRQARSQRSRSGSATGSESGPLDRHFSRFGTVTPQLQQQLNQKLVRWFVSAGNAFSQVDNEFFIDWCYTISPGFVVPGKA